MSDFYIKNNNAYSPVSNLFINVNGEWKPSAKVYLRDSNVWKLVKTYGTPSIPTFTEVRYSQLQEFIGRVFTFTVTVFNAANNTASIAIPGETLDSYNALVTVSTQPYRYFTLVKNLDKTTLNLGYLYGMKELSTTRPTGTWIVLTSNLANSGDLSSLRVFKVNTASGLINNSMAQTDQLTFLRNTNANMYVTAYPNNSQTNNKEFQLNNPTNYLHDVTFLILNL